MSEFNVVQGLGHDYRNW